jgi:hypothetical protein
MDLADYQATLRMGATALTLGHANFGNSRHLVTGFAARGATVGWKRAGSEFRVAALNATASVGWDRLLPLTNGDHRLVAASLGRELAPSRPGLARVDATWMDASRQPLMSFTQGAVVDAEASSGGSVQLSAATPGQRLRFTGTMSQSTFDNPAHDRQLSGDSALVPVETERRTARYVEIGATPLQGIAIPGLGAASATVTGHHERVDPLYRSVGSSVQADRKEDGLTTAVSVGAISGQVSLTTSRDNLGEIAALMTTRSRARSANVALALASLLRVQRGSGWLPLVSFSSNRVHQLGDVGGSGFTPDQVPDQVSRVRDVGAQWQAGPWRLQLRSNRAEQDNRQTGRATADFRSGSDAISLGASLGVAGDVSLDLGSDFQESVERDERSTTRRATLNTNLRRGPSTSVVLSLSLLRTTPSNGPATINGEQRVEITQPLMFLRDRSGLARGQAFLRFGRSTAQLPDFARLAADPFAQRRERRWTLSSGLNLRVF